MDSFKSAHEPILVSNTLAMLKHLLLRGAGIAFYTRLGFTEELANGRLVAVPLEGNRLSQLRLSLIAPTDRLPTVAARGHGGASPGGLASGRHGRVCKMMAGDPIHGGRPPITRIRDCLSSSA